MPRRLALFISLLLLCCTAAAQQEICKVSGTVVARFDMTLLSLQQASVSASFSDSSIVAGALTNSQGEFELEVPRRKDTCTLTIVCLGYLPLQVQFYADSSQISMGELLLVATNRKFDFSYETIIRTIRRCQVFTFTKPAGNGSAVDLLQTQTDVSIRPDGKLTHEGCGDLLVLLDSVPLHPTTATDSLSLIPADEVASIHIITNSNIQPEKERIGGIVNVITRKKWKSRFLGTISANYGFNHFTNGNIALRYYHNNYFSMWFSYQVKYEDDVSNGYLYRLYKTSAHGDSISQQLHTQRTQFNNDIVLGVNIHPNIHSSIYADLRLTIPRISAAQQQTNTLFFQNIDTMEQHQSDMTWNQEKLEGKLTYTHNFLPDKLSFSISTHVSQTWSHRWANYSLDEDAISRSVVDDRPLLTSAQTDWRITRKYGAWETGAKFSYRQNRIRHNFELYDNSLLNFYYHPFFSEMQHQEYVPAVYMQFTSSYWNKIKWSAGIRFEYDRVQLHSTSEEELNRTSNDFFIIPSCSFQYTFNYKHTLSIVQSMDVTRPTYFQLNPYPFAIDPHNFEQGNFSLKPETTTKFELRYQFKVPLWDVSASLYWHHTVNLIAQKADFNANILKITYVNVPQQNKWGLNVMAIMHPWWWMTTVVGADTYYVNEYLLRDNSYWGWTNDSWVTLIFSPIVGMRISLDYVVNTPHHYPQFTTRLSHYMDIGISHTFRKVDITLSAKLTDVFNTRRWEVFSDTDYYRMSNLLHGKSRMVWLGIRYSFGGYRRAGEDAPEDRTRIRMGL